MKIALCWDDNADQTLPLPAYATLGAAGADICANFGPEGGALQLAPGARALVPTGLRMAIPQGVEVQIRPRSGLALKNGITLLNSPGTIDSDYRGAVGVILINLGDAVVDITHGMRIAQIVINEVRQAEFALVDELDETARGTGGFGSTGVTS